MIIMKIQYLTTLLLVDYLSLTNVRRDVPRNDCASGKYPLAIMIQIYSDNPRYSRLELETSHSLLL